MEKKISLRVSDEDLEIIDSFIKRHDFSNRSTFLRKAAMEYINRHSVRKDEREIPATITLPKQFKNIIHYLISVGHFNNWETAIQQLVKKGVLAEDLEELKSKYGVIGETSNRVENILELEKTSEKEYMQK
ncbi:MAG: ribbon-helix-helix domain-containing protein [Candidatus Saliniplasma sp.]